MTWASLLRRAWAAFRLSRWKEPAFCSDCGEPMRAIPRTMRRECGTWVCDTDDCPANPLVQQAKQAAERAAEWAKHPEWALAAQQQQNMTPAYYVPITSQLEMNALVNAPPGSIIPCRANYLGLGGILPGLLDAPHNILPPS